MINNSNKQVFIREHDYSSTSKDLCGRYSRCIHCGETIGQGWYGTPNDKCIKRLDISYIRKYCEFANLSILNWKARGDEIFAIRRFTNEEYTFNEIIQKLQQS